MVSPQFCFPVTCGSSRSPPCFFVGGEAKLVSMKHLISKEVGCSLPKNKTVQAIHSEISGQFEKRRSLHPNMVCFFPHKKKSKWIDKSTASQKIHLRCQRHPYLSRSLRGADLPTDGLFERRGFGCCFSVPIFQPCPLLHYASPAKGIQWGQFTIGNKSQHFPDYHTFHHYKGQPVTIKTPGQHL